MSALAPTLQAFFTERLISQRQASPNTIAAYRDTFRLLLALRRSSRPAPSPASSTSPISTPTLIGAFLDHLEHERGNSTRRPETPGWRRSARSFRYAALAHPEHAATIARVLAIPQKRGRTTTVSFLHRRRDRRAARRSRPDAPGSGDATTRCC